MWRWISSQYLVILTNWINFSLCSFSHIFAKCTFACVIFHVILSFCSSSKFNTNCWWQWLITGYILSEVSTWHISFIIFLIMGFFFLRSLEFFDCAEYCSLFVHVVDSDITALAKDRAYTHINLDEMTVHQVTTVTCL